jgi:hypothetical protein
MLPLTLFWISAWFGQKVGKLSFHTLSIETQIIIDSLYTQSPIAPATCRFRQYGYVQIEEVRLGLLYQYQGHSGSYEKKGLRGQ